MRTLLEEIRAGKLVAANTIVEKLLAQKLVAAVQEHRKHVGLHVYGGVREALQSPEGQKSKRPQMNAAQQRARIQGQNAKSSEKIKRLQKQLHTGSDNSTTAIDLKIEKLKRARNSHELGTIGREGK